VLRKIGFLLWIKLSFLQFCAVDLLNFIFRIGVLLAIYNFLWWLINLGLSFIRGGRPKMLLEAYLIKGVKYIFLVDVTFLFCLDSGQQSIQIDRIIIAGLVLLIYFVGRIQSNQLRLSMLSVQGNLSGMQSMMERMKPVFSLRYEVVVVLLAVSFFFTLVFFPQWAANPISNWFLDAILDIEDTPVFGFIFKVIGFFFMISIFMKVFQGFITLLTGGNPKRDNQPDEDDNEDHFDDYTEIK
jgi:hypothetical protein